MMVSEKGQVTIPKDVRDQLGILPGSRVEFVVVDDTRVELRKAQDGGRGRRIVQRMRGHAGPGMTTDEIMSLTRDDD